MTVEQIHEEVRERYAAAAVQAGAGGCCSGDPETIGAGQYSALELAEIPDAAGLASLGCGNPIAVAELREGERVLDLGSGGGIDVLLSARRVGPTGRAIGLDMTDEMLALALRNAAEAGATNVEFLEGTIESIPLPDESVDLIISNCVINLSTDKGAVLREAFRVLKPGGRFAVSDVVIRGELPEEVRRSMELWVGCVAGALHDLEYETRLREAGFVEVDVEPWRVYSVNDARAFLAESGFNTDALAARVQGRVASAFIRARKPAVTRCCGADCCA